MATETTTNLGLKTVETDDPLPEDVVNANFDTLDLYATAKKMTNKSGGALTAGAVLVIDTTTVNAFTTTTTVGSMQIAGVLQESSAADASSLVKFVGPVVQLQVDGTTAIGDWLATGTTAGKATPTTAPTDPPTGAFAIAMSASTGAGTVQAHMQGALKQIGAGDMKKTTGGGYFMLPTGLATGTTVAASASANAYGLWVEMDASTAAALFVVGATVSNVDTANSVYLQLDIGVGEAASESSVGEWKFDYTESADTDGAARQVLFPFPIPVAISTRITVRTADGEAVANAHKVTLICVLQTDLENL